ncbi:GNAT family N-acetyltransferase [Lysinibacillus sp. KCTC 33748]|uniref:GNAT family N-acetyltransferase n=2 Tax=Lysinibacillus TaxID=400634 RepID=UPI0009A7991F|nr:MULTISPECIES: GNAT family N-acetyltransferase [unclassified Lysinibacillus]OXS70350.1 GNAT family N-acetyltransferase [Lysinibacillus sp. KCTC 33748]SKC02604.1 Acetyltransferase (GNAT) family protein [Lysinibacillus sp. AC-3]
MNMQFLSFSERPIKGTELMMLYKDAGWWEERKEKDIENMLKQDISIGVWIDDNLIGFARAVSDGKFRAYIEDVVIHNEFQKAGIGTKLVSKLLDELSHIDVISLFCGEELISFYEKNNFKFSKSQYVLHKK